MKNSNRQRNLEHAATVESKEIYKGKVFTLIQDTLHFSSLPSHRWDLILHPGAVAILPVTSSGNLLLIQQWRRPIGKIIYEIPAGTLEVAEPPLACAERELQEETGFKGKKFTPMGGFYSAPGFCNEYIHLFLAQELSESRLKGDDHEAIDVIEMSLEESLRLIDSNEINDAKTICAILRYERWLTHA